MWCGKYISFFVVFLMLFTLVNLAYGTNIGQIKINGDGYVSVTENPNADSSGIGWIPEGEFVEILSGPFVGTLDRIPVKWHKVEYKKKKGFVFSHLISFYSPSSEEDEQKDIAKIKINGNGYVNIRVSSNIDSSITGCIPEGKIVKMLGSPIQGYVGAMNGYWYKVEHQGNTGFIWGGLLKFYSLSSSQDSEGVIVIGPDDKTDEKRLAKTVIEMIKNGREIFFTYKNGKLSLETSSHRNDQDGYPDHNGYPDQDGYPDQNGYTDSDIYDGNNYAN
ncbi:MAG: SH3 domain-containing protein [Candidatus Electrothrix sp. AR4]|nr:SH3 domain-containing protein [Candidatus Electrothrix sp. AR4]